MKFNGAAKVDYPPSYYANTRKYSADYPSVEGDIEVETCIIGAGYAGIMTALGLVERRQTDIALLDKNKIGWGCSGRNGGFVFGGYSLDPHALVKQSGAERAKQIYGLTTAAVNLIRKRIEHYHLDCDVVDKGVIWANWFKDQKLLLDEQQFMRDKLDIHWQYLPPEELGFQIVSDRYHGALFEPNAMHFHPLNFALGITRVIADKGGQVFQDSEVLHVDDSNAIKVVKTVNGRILCKNIVFAGGGYMGKFYPKLCRTILPIATYVMTTEVLGDELDQWLPSQAAIYDTRFAFDYYRRLNDHRLLWGGRISANTRTPANLDYLLRKDLAKVFPGLANVKIDYVWDGWMGYSRHQMPEIGQLSENIWYNIAYGGHGVGPTTMGGEMVASAIVDNDPGYNMFKRWGLPWNGGVFGPITAQSQYWWYELKDWLRETLE